MTHAAVSALADMQSEHNLIITNIPSMHAFICLTSSDMQRFPLHVLLQVLPARTVFAVSCRADVQL